MSSKTENNQESQETENPTRYFIMFGWMNNVIEVSRENYSETIITCMRDKWFVYVRRTNDTDTLVINATREQAKSDAKYWNSKVFEICDTFWMVIKNDDE